MHAKSTFEPARLRLRMIALFSLFFALLVYALGWIPVPGSPFGFQAALLSNPVFWLLLVMSPIAGLILACGSVAISNRHLIRGQYCTCGYDLRGNTSGRCPECGRGVDRVSRRL